MVLGLRCACTPNFDPIKIVRTRPLRRLIRNVAYTHRGTIIPTMGTKKTSLGEALFTKTQRRVLGCCLATRIEALRQ